jgi:outer membrane protein assembly factor BamB
MKKRKGMNMTRSKTAAAIAMFLTLTMAITLVATPIVNAQASYRTKKTYAVVGLLPNPIGVGQEVLIWVGITDYVQRPSDGWVGLSITIERPDGKTDTINDIRTDATGATGRVYVPSIVGNYTVQTHFPAQWFNWTSPPMFDPEVYGNIWYEASDSAKVTLVVTEEPVPVYPATPLPAFYWTRPINAQHYAWNTISANWLSRPDNAYAAGNDNAPESGHILWAKPITFGGLAGGFLGEHNYETGDAYEGKWSASVIINGILYYNRYASGFGGGWSQQGVIAVDLRTGEELWFRNNTRLAFGQTFYWDSYNYHGVFAYLIETVSTFNPDFSSNTTWKFYDPFTSEWLFNIKNIPTGGVMFGPSFTITGPKGEFYIYNINQQRGWMALWNSSKVISNEGSWGSAAHVQRTFDANNGYMWNKTIPLGLPGSVAKILPDDRVIGCTASGWTSIGENPIGIWAFNLKPGQEGLLLYNTTWQPPAGMLSMSFGDASGVDKVFTIEAKETRQIWGFSTETGLQIWGPTESQAPLQIYGMTGGIAYGKLFSTGYGGILYCYDIKTGNLLWKYKADDYYNEVLWSNEWPIFVAFIAGGKVYLQSNEHSPTNPLARGSPMLAIDVETGKKVWELPIWGTSWGGAPIIGDSIVALYNSYDDRIYAIGKGPSAMTLTGPEAVQPFGTPVLVEGTVTDESAGAKGTPAIADESMSEWMQYLYMQFPRPTNATGVEVTLSVLDANGNSYEIGKATSDSNGKFSFMWTPDIPGKYTVYATFAGSKSYWPSSAETAIGVMEAPEALPQPEPAPPSMTDTYIFATGAAIIIAVAIVGAILALILRKRV